MQLAAWGVGTGQFIPCIYMYHTSKVVVGDDETGCNISSDIKMLSPSRK
jgi:hypothetical protein